LKNSIKFTPRGGTITIRSRVTDADGTADVVIAVEDTGLGIEPSQLEHVFDAFEQGGRKITQQFGGLGLGLAISKAITDAHRGTILAASDGHGRGSVFTITIPRDRYQKENTSTAARRNALVVSHEPTRTTEQPVRILLLEDHVDTAAIILRLLRRSGHHVVHAGTIAEALEMAEKEMQPSGAGIDLVISDLGLPDGSGLEVMRKLSAKYGLRGIALSGFGMDSDREQSKQAGFSHHLTKPIDIAALRSVIAEMTRKA
jgi:CheY-like chemotaxis protein